MAEGEPVDQNKETLYKTAKVELSPIEYKFIGGSSPIKGEYYNIKVLLLEVIRGDEKALIKLLTPVLIQHDSSSEAKNFVLEKRQENNPLEGLLSIFDVSRMKEILQRKLHHCLELSELDKTGLVVPHWKVYLADRSGNIVNDREIFGNQKIKDEFSSGLKLSDIDIEQKDDQQVFYRTISLQS